MEEENLLVETVAKVQVTFSAAMFPVLKRMEGSRYRQNKGRNDEVYDKKQKNKKRPTECI